MCTNCKKMLNKELDDLLDVVTDMENLCMVSNSTHRRRKQPVYQTLPNTLWDSPANDKGDNGE